MPDSFGYTDYMVISDNESPMVYDYQMGLDRKMRPIHRYNRVERFSFTLAQLLGLKGDVDRTIIDTVRVSGAADWNGVRAVLKENNLRRYYNRIPYILNCLGHPSPISIHTTNELYREIVDEFRVIQQNFLEDKGDRKYFPSLRYIAFKMLEERGADFDPAIMFVRTKRKEKALSSLWDKINN